MYFGSTKRLILITATSLLAALAVAWFGLKTQGAPRDTEIRPQAAPAVAAVAPETSVTILTAARSLAPGAAIPPEAMGQLRIPEDQMKLAFLTDTPENRAALTAHPARREIPAGTAFVADDLLAPQPAPATPRPTGSAALLRPGMSAIAVPVTAETAVAGLISSDDRVDVLMSYDTRDGLRAVRTILRNVRVIARDRLTAGDIATAGVPRTITLELDPEGAKVLALAMQTGDLLLVLSPPGGGEVPMIVQDEPMLSSRISGGDAPRAPVAATASVQVFRGDGSQRVLTLPDLVPPTSP